MVPAKCSCPAASQRPHQQYYRPAPSNPITEPLPGAPYPGTPYRAASNRLPSWVRPYTFVAGYGQNVLPLLPLPFWVVGLCRQRYRAILMQRRCAVSCRVSCVTFCQDAIASAAPAGNMPARPDDRRLVKPTTWRVPQARLCISAHSRTVGSCRNTCASTARRFS